MAASGRHSVFWELFWDVLSAIQGGRACYEGCFFWHFQAAQPILEGLKLSFADIFLVSNLLNPFFYV